MTRPRTPVTAAIAAALAISLAACSGGGAASPTAGPPTAVPSQAAGGELTVLAAASLKGAVEKAKAVYEAANPGMTITVSTGASSALATQIAEGAPADVFLSADAANPQKLVDEGLVRGDPVTFASNKLVVVVPADNPAGIASPADLATPGLKVIAAGEEVPITKYATQVVDNLAAEPGYPADFAAAYAANVASREEDVKSVVAKIELGEGDAAIVYATDAAASDTVVAIDVPDSANVPATYQGVVVEGTRQPDAAAAFLTWLAGRDGQAVLRELGFLPPAS